MAIEKCFPDNPDSVIHMTANFMQMWCELQKERDKAKMREMGQCLEDWLSKKESMMGLFSDIEVM
jgi:hypothetical protein